MKKYLALLLLSPFLVSDPAKCSNIEPPIIEYKHFQIDAYLFTHAGINPYTRGRVDYSCIESYFIVTKPKGSLPWYKQDVLFEDSDFKDVSFIGSMSNKNKDIIENYSIFEGFPHGGAAGPIVMVFMTSPELKLVFMHEFNLNKESVNLNSFTGLERTPNVHEKCGWVSMAHWPADEVTYTFENGEYAHKIIKEGACPAVILP